MSDRRQPANRTAMGCSGRGIPRHDGWTVGFVPGPCLPGRTAGQHFPTGILRTAAVPISTWKSGDVFARAYVRWLEIQSSAAFIREQLAAITDGPVCAEVGPLKPDHQFVSLV